MTLASSSNITYSVSLCGSIVLLAIGSKLSSLPYWITIFVDTVYSLEVYYSTTRNVALKHLWLEAK